MNSAAATDDFPPFAACVPSIIAHDVFYSFTTPGGLDFEAAIRVPGADSSPRALILLNACGATSAVDCTFSMYDYGSPYVIGRALPAGTYVLVVEGNGYAKNLYPGQGTYQLTARLYPTPAPLPIVDGGAGVISTNGSFSNCYPGMGICPSGESCFDATCGTTTRGKCTPSMPACTTDLEQGRPVCSCAGLAFANSCQAVAAGQRPVPFAAVTGSPGTCAPYPEFHYCSPIGFLRNRDEVCVTNGRSATLPAICMGVADIEACLSVHISYTACGMTGYFFRSGYYQQGGAYMTCIN